MSTAAKVFLGPRDSNFMTDARIWPEAVYNENFNIHENLFLSYKKKKKKKKRCYTVQVC